MTQNAPMLSLDTPTKTSEYTPEQFWFDRTEVYVYREKLFSSDTDIESWCIDESDGNFLYKWRKQNDPTGNECGWYYFSQVPNNGKYEELFTQSEAAVFKNNPEIAKQIVWCKNIVECWPWLWWANKVKHLIYALYLEWNGKLYSHIWWDISWRVTAQLVNEYGEWDFMKGIGLNSSRDKVTAIEWFVNKAIIMFWWSIWSRSEDENIKFLSSFASWTYTHTSPLVLSFFPAPEWESKENKRQEIIAWYQTKEAEHFVMKWIESLWLPMNDLEYAIEYKEWQWNKPDRVRVWARLLHDIEIYVWWGKKMTKKAGEFVCAIPSRRYTDDQFTDMLEKANCKKVKIYGDKWMKVAVSRTPRKKFSEKQQYFALVLALLLWVSWLTYNLTNQAADTRRKEAQKKQSTELQKALWCSNDVYFNQLLDEILNDLEYRYWNTLTQNDRVLLTWKVLDFFSSHQTLLSYGYGSWLWMIYSTDLYTPSMMDMFIAENLNLLVAMRLNTIPNHWLWNNSEALANSYYYAGERQEFLDVDTKLIDYVSGWAGVSPDGKPFYFTYPCGIKYIDWKPYFVVKRAGAEWYVLEEKTPNLQSNWWLCAGDIVTEILARWQVQIFAERIQDFIQLRYGDKMVAAMNGQDVIASYLIDLYAEWRDLGFLFWTTNDVSDPYWYLRDSPLHDFVLAYVLPAVSDKLVNGVDWGFWSSRMYDLDLEKIADDQKKLVDLSLLLPEVYDFINHYIPNYTHDIQEWKMKSIIMKHLLIDPAGRKLDITDKQSLRAWVTIHAQRFNEDWINVPSFPTRVDNFLAATSWPTYDPSDDLQGISWKDAHAWGMEQIQFWSYFDIEGNEYDLWVYMVSFFKWKVVGRINNQSSDEHLLRRWKEGEFGAIEIQTPWWNIPLTDENSMLLEKLRDKAITYSSAPVGHLLADYQERRAAMEKFKQ